ncbi:hypothetical protein WJX77_010549 [Trebouxia sp. C0004]
MGIPRIHVKAGGVVGVAAAVVGGGVKHLRNRSRDAARSHVRQVQLLTQQLVQQHEYVQDLEAGVHSLQVSEASAVERAVSAESSNAQLSQAAQGYQRALQELSNSRNAVAVSHQQALQTLRNAKALAEDRAEEERNHVKQRLAASQAESRNILEQAQLSHKLVVQGLQRQLHDALEGRTAAEGQLEGQLTTEQEAHRAVSKHLAGAQKDMEEVVQHNRELQRANANMGEEAHRVHVEQEELRARLEAQSAKLASVKVEKPNGRNAVQAEVDRMGRDASDAAYMQQQLQQLQSKERLLGEVTDANKQAQAELAAQAAGRQRAVGDLQEQVGRVQEQVARAQDALSPAQEEAAVRLQTQVGVLQQQLSSERDLMVEAQITISTTQEEGRRLLHRAETAEGQVHHLESEKLNLSTKLADIQQQLPALQLQLESAVGVEQFAMATAERLGSQVETLHEAVAELKRQLEQQSSQLSSQATELGNTRLKLQETQVACKALEKAHARAERLNQELQAVMAARQLVQDNLVDATEKLAAFDKMLKAITKKKEASSSRKLELQKQKFDLEEQVQGLDEQLESCRIQLEEEAGQNFYLVNQVEVLRTQLVSAGLEPACVKQANENHDALSLPEAESQGGQEDDEVMHPQSLGSTLGSTLGSPHIAAGWGNLSAGASSSSDAGHSLKEAGSVLSKCW